MFGYKDTATWQDCTFRVRAALVPRYFWTTVSVDVYCDDACLIRTGGVWRLKGVEIAEFEHNGKRHIVQLSWQSSGYSGFILFRLTVDGQLILNSRVFPKNWPLFVLPAMAIWLLVVGVGQVLSSLH